MVMEGSEKSIEVRATEALGKGFDISGDFRLKYAKGTRLVVLDETNKRDIVLPGAFTLKDVPQDIRLDKGDRIRFKSDVLEFNQMSELLNQKSSIQGKVPSGFLNAIFDLSGDWLHDAADTKNLAFDGYFISLYHLHLTASPLILHDSVKKSVPSHWDPAALSRFIQTYGTHIIVGMAIGGQDLLCVRQNYSSTIPPSDLREYLEDIGDVMFSDGKSPSLLQRKTRDGKQKVPEVFNHILQSNSLQLASIAETSSKDGLTIISSKRGGNVFLGSRLYQLNQKEFCSNKPVPEDLRYFLEFQVPRQWAPMFCELPLRHQRKKSSCPSLQFAFLGPKIHVNCTQVSSDLKPVVGLRLYLEGKKCNRLALHVQHLSSLPNMMASTSGRPCQWRGSDDYKSSDQFLEPIRWKRYSNVCTSVVMHDPNWLQEVPSGVFIVTGAQLLCKGKWPKTVLHLRLLYNHIPNCTIKKTEWAAAPETSRKANFLTNLSTTFTFTQRTVTGQQKQAPTALNSGVYPDGPPAPIRSKKLLRYVDISEVVRGPHDAPGHWLVTAAKLVNEGGKISLQVKFALLEYP
ncbi:hypothetical protein V6N13_025326 [Hibiscus sabdariffa]|uniref:MACPF domain-containing protein n=2 Tax=Hibiscus sabdariffa TaxID=183260 RepID=A0ABR2BKJ3_9ROSI